MFFGDTTAAVLAASANRLNVLVPDGLGRAAVPVTVRTTGGVSNALIFNSLLPGDLLANLTEERSGDITLQFINNTPFRASFTAGVYDDLDRDPPGQVVVQQRAVEGNDSTEVITTTCARDLSVGTDKLVQRIQDTGADQVASFNQDLFSAQVNFSSAPADSDAANQPVEGFAEGITLRLANDYACLDRVLFVFEQDATAPGGFRIDVTVIEDQFGDE